jgi:hypothetical protein
MQIGTVHVECVQLSDILTVCLVLPSNHTMHKYGQDEYISYILALLYYIYILCLVSYLTVCDKDIYGFTGYEPKHFKCFLNKICELIHICSIHG